MLEALAVTPPPPPPWQRPDIHHARRDRLVTRSRIARAFRDWFEAQGFIETETAALQASPCAETHLHAFATELVSPQGGAQTLYMRTSPELACKKLLAAGETRIFELARVWRNRELGPLHQPEFTLLEWYRAEAPFAQLMEDCAALLALAARTAGTTQFAFRGRACDPTKTPQRITVAEAFDRFAGVDLMASVGPGGETDRERLAQGVSSAGIRIAPDDGWSDIFSRALVERVEPALGLGRPTILCEYPLAEAALARAKPGDGRVAERFELYACGVELANAFGELTDAAEQRRRFQTAMDDKARLYGERYPVDEDFLAAVGGMPEASGAALGFDRLVMLATGASSLDEVTWTPLSRIP
jgi:lysyl-tRNA synthetase class 2